MSTRGYAVVFGLMDNLSDIHGNLEIGNLSFVYTAVLISRTSEFGFVNYSALYRLSLKVHPILSVVEDYIIG